MLVTKIGIFLEVIFLYQVTMTQLEFAHLLAGWEWREDHHDVPPNQLGLLVNIGHTLDVPLDALHFFKPDFPVSIFPSTELQLRAHLVTFFEEGLDPPQFDIVVMQFGSHPELDLLEARDGLALTCLLELRLFVLPLSVVDHTAYRRIGLGSNFHQVEADGLGSLDSLPGIHDPKLFTLAGYDPHTWGPDPLINPRHVPTWTKSLLLFLSDSISPVLLRVRNESANGDAEVLRASCQGRGQRVAASLKATQLSSAHSERFRISSHTWSTKSLRVMEPRSSRSR